jgi:hypothetical protein
MSLNSSHRRQAHIDACAAAPAACPYAPCPAQCTRAEIDKHTFACPYSNHYAVQSITARIAAVHKGVGAMDDAALYHAFLQERAAAPATGGASGRHRVTDSDTLAGIALRYGAALSLWPRFTLLSFFRGVFR